MVDHFSDLTYVHLVGSTIQENTLAGKSVFERWVATFGFKIKIYHADNGIFSEQPFISSTEDANQTINLLGLYLIIKMSFLKEKIQL